MPENYRIWHPFTQHQISPDPIKVISGKGAKLVLEDGRQVIDGISSWWVNLHGHSHPKIAEAICAQAQKLEHVIFAEFTHDPAEQLAQAVAEILPAALNNLFFSDNGSTSVEVALKMAYQFHLNRGQKRKKFYSFTGGYHGDTLGALSVGRYMAFPFLDLLFEVRLFPYPSEGNEEQVLEEIRRGLAEEGSEVAALIVEPLVQGVAGMRMTTPLFMQKLSVLLKEADVLQIYDEVMTGFGRTGHYFACQRAGTVPDILCLAKGLTGGFLPLALTCVTDAIYNAFLSSDLKKTFYHGHSYTANPLGCAAGIASMQLLHEQKFAHLETWHLSRMAKLAQDERLENPRILGTIAAIDIKAEEAGYINRQAIHLRHAFLQHGVLLRPLGSTLYIMPPYCIAEEELDCIYASIPLALSSNDRRT